MNRLQKLVRPYHLSLYHLAKIVFFRVNYTQRVPQSEICGEISKKSLICFEG